MGSKEFGNVRDNIKKSSYNLLCIQQVIDSQGFSNSLFQAELKAHKVLDLELQREEMILKDQSRLKWLKCGDQNTIFFHRLFAAQKVSKNMNTLSIDGYVTFNAKANWANVLDFYSFFFSNFTGS